MRKQHIAAVSSEFFCLRLLTFKNQFAHSFLTDVIVIFSRVLGPIHEVRFRNEPCQLSRMSIIFSTTKVLYKISSLSGFAILNALYTSLARVQDFSLIVTTQFYYIKENGMTEDILFVVHLWSKKFCIWSSDTKRPCL